MMSKKGIIAFFTVLCFIAVQFSVLSADDDELSKKVDYSESYGKVEGAEVPTASELRAEMNKAHKDKNKRNIMEIGRRDYSTYIAKTDNITVSIDESDQWELNKEMLGIQYEITDCYNTYYTNNELNTNYIEFSKRAGKIPVLRLGGMNSTNMNFLYNVGPFKDRKITPKKIVPGVPILKEPGGAAAYKMGIPEMVKMLYQNNPDASLLVCVSLWCTTPEEIANLAHYFADDKDESKWGALRAADGIEEPIKIWYWELGNETDGFGRLREQLRMDNYVKYARAAAEAIRSVTPAAKIMANGPTAPWGDYWNIKEYTPRSWTSWHMGIMPELVDIVDGVAMHPYYDGNSPEFAAMYFADKLRNDVMKMIEEQDIRNPDGKLKEIEVIITEHNRWAAIGDINNDFQSAMSVSHFYNLAFQRPWMTGSTLHNLDGSWCAFWYTADGEFIMTPTAKMHKMYLENLGDRVCKSSWLMYNDDDTVYDPTNDPYFERDYFSVLATPNGENELKVILTNKTAYRDINVTFDFAKHDYTLVEEISFKAPNSATYCVDKGTENLVTVTKTPLNIPNCTSYTTPTEGVVILTFRTTDKMQQLGEDLGTAGEAQVVDAPKAEKDAFSDISDSYAKNEITALAGSSIINGRSIDVFEPKANITRAEFFAILAKTLKLNKYKGNIWQDVSDDAWYLEFANALYMEKIIQGDTFRAQDGISIQELMTIAGNICIKHDNALNNGEIAGDGVYLNVESAYAVSKGLFSKLIEYGKIDVSRLVTREDAAAVIYKLDKMVN